MKHLALLCLTVIFSASGSVSAESIRLFNEKDMTDWTALWEGSEWFVCENVLLNEKDNKQFDIKDGQGVMVNGKTGKTANLLSKTEHGDCQLHIEFIVPKNSNSGVYLHSLYEIQVLDSYGKEEVSYLDCGGIYQRWDEKANKAIDKGHAPRVNASKAPGEWQSFDITFRAPRFDKNGVMTEKPRFVLVVHNGHIVHENVELQGPTRAYNTKQKPAPKAPLMLQGDHGPVAYRHIRIVPLDLP
jgi:hypothetical protein